MTSSNGNVFRVTGLLCGEFTGHRWIPLTKGRDAELWCYLWFALWINGWVNNRETDDLRRHRAHYDVIVMSCEWIHGLCHTKSLIQIAAVHLCYTNKLVNHLYEIAIARMPFGLLIKSYVWESRSVSLPYAIATMCMLLVGVIVSSIKDTEYNTNQCAADEFVG